MDTGDELVTVNYRLDDGDWVDDWIFVPMSFPHGEWSGPESWASAVAAETFEKKGDRRWFRDIALAVATDFLSPNIDMLLWYVPESEVTTGLARMRFVEYDEDVADTEEWALLGLPESETPVQVTRHPSERLDEIVQVAITFRGDDQTVAGHLRTVTFGETRVICLEATDADLTLLARMQSGLVSLVDSVSELVEDQPNDRHQPGAACGAASGAAGHPGGAARDGWCVNVEGSSQVSLA